MSCPLTACEAKTLPAAVLLGSGAFVASLPVALLLAGGAERGRTALMLP